MLVEILLELLVGIVDVELFEPVHLQDGGREVLHLNYTSRLGSGFLFERIKKESL